MNLILLFQHDFITENKVRLQGRRFQHIKKVLKSSVGDELCVGLLNDKMGQGKIVCLDDKYVEIDINLNQNPPKKNSIHLILALPRPIVLKRLLSSITTLGVEKIVLLHSQRVEKSFWKSPVLQESQIKESLVFGLEQAKDTVIPEVILRKQFKPFVEDELPNMIKGKIPLVAHPDGARKLSGKLSGAITLMIGPEGGFIPYEIEKLERIGFQAISLGKRILRVETAVSVLLGKLL